jgi:hypothetical protein
MNRRKVSNFPKIREKQNFFDFLTSIISRESLSRGDKVVQVYKSNCHAHFVSTNIRKPHTASKSKEREY